MIIYFEIVIILNIEILLRMNKKLFFVQKLFLFINKQIFTKFNFIDNLNYFGLRLLQDEDIYKYRLK